MRGGQGLVNMKWQRKRKVMKAARGMKKAGGLELDEGVRDVAPSKGTRTATN